MLGQLQKNIQPLCRRKFPVKIAIGFVGFGETLMLANSLLHATKYNISTSA
jgi:hypothetical protein